MIYLKNKNNFFIVSLCNSCVTRSLTQLIRVENIAKMNHVVLRVVSHANNADSWGHIKDEQLVGALEH